MIRAIRCYFARKAFEQADFNFRSYQKQPAFTAWNIRVAVALQTKADEAAARYAAFIHTPHSHA